MSILYWLKKLNLRLFRYVVLVVFLVCNCLVPSFAMWNLGLVQVLPNHGPLQAVECYLAFVGCSGLILTFFIAFVEITRKHWFLGTVWFECLWVSLWGSMFLAGSIALTAILSVDDCHSNSEASTCVSSQVLLVFTWLIAMTLNIYLIIFLVAVLINRKRDSTIWYSMMRKFPWSGTCAILASPPSTPTAPQFMNTSVPVIRAPKPRHPRPIDRRDPIFSFASGPNRQYEIEHYTPSVTTHSIGESHSLSPPSAAAPPMLRPHALPLSPTEPSATENIPSFLYPLYVQQAADANQEQPSRPQPALTRGNSNAAAALHQEPMSTRSYTPPPLGNWPRPDILSQPAVRGKRKAPPPIATGNRRPAVVNLVSSPAGAEDSKPLPLPDVPQPSTSGMSSPRAKNTTSTTTAPSSYLQSRLHPAGPRRRSGSSDYNPSGSQSVRP